VKPRSRSRSLALILPTECLPHAFDQGDLREPEPILRWLRCSGLASEGDDRRSKGVAFARGSGL
jgi:hypothetical protein